jgi:hypothetical protein
MFARAAMFRMLNLAGFHISAGLEQILSGLFSIGQKLRSCEPSIATAINRAGVRNRSGAQRRRNRTASDQRPHPGLRLFSRALSLRPV